MSCTLTHALAFALALGHSLFLFAFTLSLNISCGVLTVAVAATGRLHVHLAVLVLGLRKSTDSRDEGECKEIFHFVVFTSRIRINKPNFTIRFVLSKQSTGNKIENKDENNTAAERLLRRRVFLNILAVALSLSFVFTLPTLSA